MKPFYRPYLRPRAVAAALLLGASSLAAKNYVVQVLNSAGDPQTGMILRIEGKEYTSDEQGLIEFPYEGNGDPWIYLYFPTDKNYCVKSFSLEEADTQPVFRIDSPQDIRMYKQQGTTFPIEGRVKDDVGRFLEGVSISVQGTRRKTVTDPDGLFRIEGDYAHPIVVRAPGMETRTLPISRFLAKPDDPYIVYLSTKNVSTVYSTAEQMPEFPGGMKAFRAYLDQHLEYPPKAKAAKTEGVVVVRFIVERNGSISDAQIARRLEATMDTAALEVIETMPDWIPARDNGKAIRCRYSVPVTFKLPKPRPKPAATEVPPMDTLRPLGIDSTALAKDSLTAAGAPSAANDSLAAADSLIALPADSLPPALHPLQVDRPVAVTDSTQVSVQPNDSTDTALQSPTEKARKGNIFARIARFFRRLFGIKK